MLNKALSRTQIKADIKDLENTPFLLRVIAAINKAATRKQLRQDLQEIENTQRAINLKTTVNSQNVKKNIQNAIGNKTYTANVNARVDEQGLQSSFGRLWSGVLQRFSAMTVMFTGFRIAKQSLTDTLELDKYLTNLLKVTDELNGRDSLPKYLQRSNEMAKKLSISTGDLIQSVTEFAKLGYSLNDAEKLAADASMFANVADTNITTASQVLISGVAAFKEINGLKEGDFERRALAIADALNEVGNRFAISSEGIGEALIRSSAAMSLAGNDLHETIALITAANKIIQNPEQVGTALKMISVRLRNTKGELEQLGEEADGAAESITALQTQILNLTKGTVNIFDDKGNFKNTYDILLEIGKIYDKLTSTDQASLLELIAGRQRSNVAAALLMNIDEVAAVYEASLQSVGSATAEFTKYQQSAEASIERFKQTWIGIFTDIISGEEVKRLADIGTGALNLADKLGLLRNGLAGLAVYSGAKLFVSMFSGIKEAIVHTNSLAAALKIVEAGHVGKSGLSQLAILTKNLSDNQQKLVLSSKSLTAQQQVQILVQQGLTQEEAAAKLATLGLSAANTTATVTTATLKAAAQSLWAVLKANPIMWIALSVTAVSSAYSAWKNNLIESRKAMEDHASKLKEEADDITRLTLRYQELAEALANGEGQDNSTRLEIKSIQDQIVQLMGKQASAIDLVNGSLAEELDKLRDISLEQAKQAKNALEAQKIITDQRYAGTTPDPEAPTVRTRAVGKALQQTGLYPLGLDDYGQAMLFAGKDARETLSILETWRDAFLTLGSDGSKALADLTKSITYFEGIVTESEKATRDFLSASATVDVLEDLKRVTIDTQEAFDGYIGSIKTSGEYSEEYKRYLIDFANSLFPQFATAAIVAADSLYQQVSAVKELNNVLKSLADQMAILETAEKEIADSGEITAGTFEKLTENNLLQYLEVVDGKLRVNKASLEAEAEAAKISAIETLKLAMTQDVLALAEGRAEDLSKTAKAAIDSLGGGMEDAGDKAQTAAGQLAGFAVAAQAVVDGAAGNLSAGVNLDDFKAQAGAIVGAYSNFANSISKITIGSAKKASTGGSSKEIELYIANINDLYAAELKLKEIQEKISVVETKKSNSDYYADQIEYLKRLIPLYKDEQTALQELNSLRSAKINDNVGKLQGAGFTVEYNAEVNRLYIANQEHINDLTGGTTEKTNELRKAYESLISETIKLNDENQSTSKSIFELGYTIGKTMDEMVKSATSGLDEVSTLYDNLLKAAEGFADSGFLTTDQLKSIIASGVQYLALLENEEGQLSVNREGIEKLIAARTQELAVQTALNYVANLRQAVNDGDAESLNRLLYATDATSKSTWGLVYANLAIVRAMGLSDEQYNQAIDNLNNLRSLMDSTISGIGQAQGTIKQAASDQEKALNNLVKMVENLIKQQKQDQIAALRDNIAAMKELIDLRKRELTEMKRKADFEKSLMKTTKSLASLQAEYMKLSRDNSGDLSVKARKQQIAEEIQTLQDNINEQIADRYVEQQSDAYDQDLDKFTKIKEAEISEIQDFLNKQGLLTQEAMRRIETEGQSLYDALIGFNRVYGDSFDSTVISAWDNAYEALNRYKTALGELSVANTLSQLGNVTGAESTMPKSNNIVANAGSYNTEPKIWYDPTVDYAALLQAAEARNAALEELIMLEMQRNAKIDGLGLESQGYAKTYKYAKKYHSGGIVDGDDDEVFAILKRKELVLTEPQKKVAYEYISLGAEIAEAFKDNVSKISLNTQMPNSMISNLIGRDQRGNITNNASSGVTIGDIKTDINIQGNADQSTVEALKRERDTIANYTIDAITQRFRMSGIVNRGSSTPRI